MGRKRLWYYWYHHCSFESQESIYIDSLIENHDFEGFMDYYQKWNGMYDDLLYFPKTARDEDFNYYDITDESNFMQIAFVEHECG